MMWYKWEIYCYTEEKYIFEWRPEGDDPPTVCPHNPEHNIDAEHIVIRDEAPEPYE